MTEIKDLGVINGRRRGLYECECGKQVDMLTSNYKRNPDGFCKSCSTRKTKTKHGSTNTRLYNIWSTMRQRCSNVNHIEYKRYGAVGVTVWEEWDNDFESFKAWSLDNGYSNELVIDKDILCNKLSISPKIYSPETCMWITVTENNKEARARGVIQYTLDGIFVADYDSAVDASKVTGIQKTHIGEVARNKTNRKKAGGFKWTFKHEQNTL